MYGTYIEMSNRASPNKCRAIINGQFQYLLCFS